MKILHSIRSVNPAGGGPIEGIKQMARFHLEMNTEIEIVSLDSPNDSWVKEFSVPIHALGPVKTNYGYTPLFTSWLEENYARFDAVIINGIWQYNSFGVWRVLRKTDIPFYVFIHGMLDPWFKRTYPLKHFKKWLYWPWAEYRVLRDARKVFFTCEEERRLARQSFWLYHCREAVVGYGTSAPPGDPFQQRAQFVQKYPQLGDQRIFLFLSRIHEKKGIDLLLKAFAQISSKIPALHLVIAGPCAGDLRQKLEQMAEKLGISRRVTWTGMLQGDLKWGAFHAAEVFILPSHQENFGIAVAEALACSLPVLISNKVNIYREIEKCGAGFVADDNLDGILALCCRWLDLDSSAILQMRSNALDCFERNFEIRCLVKRFTAELEE